MTKYDLINFTTTWSFERKHCISSSRCTFQIAVLALHSICLIFYSCVTICHNSTIKHVPQLRDGRGIHLLFIYVYSLLSGIVWFVGYFLYKEAFFILHFFLLIDLFLDSCSMLTSYVMMMKYKIKVLSKTSFCYCIILLWIDVLYNIDN